MKRIIFSLLVLPFLLQAVETKSVENYLKDSNVLSRDILKLERVLDGKISGQEREKVDKLRRHLNDLKAHLHDVQNDSGLDQAITISNQNQWTNTSTFLYRIKTACSIIENLENECFVYLSDFDKFIDTRKIPEETKVKFHQLINEYSKHNEARIIINDKFINDTDELLINTKDILAKMEKPFATIKIISREEKKSLVVKEISEKNDLAEKFWTTVSVLKSWKDGLWYAVSISSVFLLGLFLMKFVMRRREANKINHFYSSIFFITQKQNIKTKIFGRIKKSNSAKLKTIDKIYIDLLNVAGSLKSNIDLKIKNKEQKIVLETVVYSSTPLQECILSEACSKFNEKLISAEKKIQMAGGELHITNFFDEQGKFANSSFTFII